MPEKLKFNLIFKSLAERLRLRFFTTETIFTDIHRKNFWNGTESISGPGSDLRQTLFIRKELPRLFEKFDIESVLDIPCGDFHWMSRIDFKHIQYTGADIVREIIETNTAQFESSNIQFLHLNIIRDHLPSTDLLFCRDCFVHFSNNDILASLGNICNSGSRYLLTTTFPKTKRNRSIPTGRWRPINLQYAPFSLPDPMKLINERCTEGNDFYRDKSLGLWSIHEIRDLLKNRQRIL